MQEEDEIYWYGPMRTARKQYAEVGSLLEKAIWQEGGQKFLYDAKRVRTASTYTARHTVGQRNLASNSLSLIGVSVVGVRAEKPVKEKPPLNFLSNIL